MTVASQTLNYLVKASADISSTTDLLAPAAAPQLMRSSPHLATLAWFTARYASSARRRAILDALHAQLSAMRDRSLEPLCLLIGGGFLREGDEPGDLDALVVYRFSAPTGAPPPMIPQAVGTGLDLRYVPADAEPELLIKMCCFFHTLYQSRDRGGRQASLIVTNRDDLAS